jgi:hypothetical protein
MGSFGGELTRDTSDVQTSSTITMRARNRDKPKTTPMNDASTKGGKPQACRPWGREVANLWGVVDTLFIERTCGPLEAVRIKI